MSVRFVRHSGCIGLISLVLSLAAAPAWSANALPEMGNSVDEVLSPADEARLGREVIQQLRGMNALLDDPLIDRYLQSLGQRLVSQSSAAGDPFLFFAVRDGRVNAFALPGGYVGVNTGLIVLTRSESELAGVLAHEVSHVAQRHIARRMADSRQANILTGAATLAAILAGAGAGSGQMVQGAISAGMAATVQNAISFTLQNEKEADRIGMHLLADSGFDPAGMPSFFELMAQQSRYYETAYSDFLRSHPLNTERISEATDRARMVPNRPASVASSRAYVLARSRVRTLTAQDLMEQETGFRSEIDRADGLDEEAARYGLGLILLRKAQGPAALEVFTALIKAHPEVPEYRLGLAEAQQASQDTDAALATYRQSLALFPDDSVLSLDYARTLLIQGDAAAAYAQLERLPAAPEITTRRLRLLAQAAEQLGRKGESHAHLGEYLALQGQTREAIAQMSYALREPDLDADERQRIESRRKALLQEMRDARDR
ncbi:MAG: M48 family metalloprotease [Pseudomonadota bacterium]